MFNAKQLNKIDPEVSYGDTLHNEMIDTLFEGVDKRRKPYKETVAFLENLLEGKQHDWIHNSLTKTETKRLNGIMKSKTDKTFYKRLAKQVNRWIYDTRYGAMFNSDNVEMIFRQFPQLKDHELINTEDVDKVRSFNTRIRKRG